MISTPEEWNILMKSEKCRECRVPRKMSQVARRFFRSEKEWHTDDADAADESGFFFCPRISTD